MFAFVLPILFGISAFGVDLGAVYLARRTLQQATDAAATAVAGKPAEADDIVERLLAAYGYPAATHTIVYGTYHNDPSIDRDRRFTADPAGDAIRIRTAMPWTFIFGKFVGLERVPILVSADAVVTPQVSFSVGSRLASVDPPLVNGVLGPLLGANFSLVAVDYRWLARAEMELGSVLGRLHDKTGPTPMAADLLQTTVTAAILFSAMSDEMVRSGDLMGSSILRKAANSALAGQTTVRLADLVLLDERETAIAAAYPASALRARVSVLGLVNATIRQNGLGTALSAKLTLPGVAKIGIAAEIGEAMQSAHGLAVGGPGTTLSTDQVRLRLLVDSLDAIPGLAVIHLPVEIVAAGGTAWIESAMCSADAALREVSVLVRPGVVRLSIGDWKKALSDASVLDRLGKARILDLLVARIDASANVALEQTTPIRLVFRGTEIGNGTVKTARTKTFVESAVANLLGQTKLEASVLGLGLSVGPVLAGARVLLAGLATPLDNVVNAALGVAGIGLGELDIRVDDLQCGRGQIVG